MNGMLLNLHVKFQDLKNRDDGQDLAEYALTVSLLGFSAVAGINSLAAGLGTAFTNLSITLGNNL
jgi:Flp pilus assembly pilin Flp